MSQLPAPANRGPIDVVQDRMNSTVVPFCTTTTCGSNFICFWSTVTCCAGAGKSFPGMASTYTTMFSADFNPRGLTFPLISPPCAAAVESNVIIASKMTNGLLRFMLVSFLRCARVRQSGARPRPVSQGSSIDFPLRGFCGTTLLKARTPGFRQWPTS